LNGTVVRGDGRGKTLQFPTANIELDSKYKLVPRDGVYAVLVRHGEERFKGMMNIGMRPTFDSLVHVLEVHIFDFNREIYDEKLTIEFVDRLRDEIRFTNADELVKQLERDKSKSLSLL
jgi:riboflavin kinase/FMN adenylyltransferase